MKNKASIFTITLASPHTFFYSLQTKFYCNLLKTKPKNFQLLSLYKIFHKAGSSCLRVFAFWEERGQLELF